jgi:hypothetical protein
MIKKNIKNFSFLVLISISILSGCAYNKLEEVKVNAPVNTCDTTIKYTYSDVEPIFNGKGCIGCHSFGQEPELKDLQSFKAFINSNKERFEKSVKFEGNHPMPKGGPKLPQDEINKILLWVCQGTK